MHTLLACVLGAVSSGGRHEPQFTFLCAQLPSNVGNGSGGPADSKIITLILKGIGIICFGASLSDHDLVIQI